MKNELKTLNKQEIIQILGLKQYGSFTVNKDEDGFKLLGHTKTPLHKDHLKDDHQIGFISEYNFINSLLPLAETPNLLVYFNFEEYEFINPLNSLIFDLAQINNFEIASDYVNKNSEKLERIMRKHNYVKTFLVANNEILKGDKQ